MAANAAFKPYCPLGHCSLAYYPMDFNCLTVGRRSLQLQTRTATDTQDNGTYHMANLALITEVGGDKHQTSVGLGVRQDEVSKEAQMRQNIADEEEWLRKHPQQPRPGDKAAADS